MSETRQIDKYEIVEEIGRGGFAAVYKARDPTLDRIVALKVLAPHLTWDPRFVERFRREAKAVASLRHPNIVIVHEIGEDAGQVFIAMEYLQGRTLAQVIADEGALPLDKAVAILEQVADALDYAHGQGAIHRDIKPSNIMVDENGRTKVLATLMDFGLVRAMEHSESLTSVGTVLGSPEYMAPEQADYARRDEIGPATDRYSLGVVAYQMLTGQVPFSGPTTTVLHAHVYEAPPDPQTIREDLSHEIAQVLLKALAKTPQDRHPSAGEMVLALQAAARAQDHARQHRERLAALYNQLLETTEAQDWDTAEAQCRRILGLEPAYRDVPAILARVQGERTQRQERVDALYEEAKRLVRSGQWQQALSNLQAIQDLAPDFADAEGIATKARAGMAEEEKEAQRREALARMYAEAVRLLRAEQYREALAQWEEVRAQAPDYPDRQKVRATAQGKLRALDKSQAGKEPEQVARTDVTPPPAERRKATEPRPAEKEAPLWQRALSPSWLLPVGWAIGWLAGGVLRGLGGCNDDCHSVWFESGWGIVLAAAVGGLIVGLALSRTRALRQRNRAAIVALGWAIGWIAGWAIGWPFQGANSEAIHHAGMSIKERFEDPVAKDIIYMVLIHWAEHWGGAGFVAGLVAGSVGGLVTGLVWRWADASVRWGRILTSTLVWPVTWAIAWTIGGIIAASGGGAGGTGFRGTAAGLLMSTILGALVFWSFTGTGLRKG